MVSTVDLSFAEWRRSSYSNGGGNAACVEVAFAAEVVAVRDSKLPSGGALLLSEAAWGALRAVAAR
nr:DUF397 domain-containing protein [Amycolatopsis cihanbeyliensis]